MVVTLQGRLGSLEEYFKCLVSVGLRFFYPHYVFLKCFCNNNVSGLAEGPRETKEMNTGYLLQSVTQSYS